MDNSNFLDRILLTEEDYQAAGLRPRLRKVLPSARPYDPSEVIPRIIATRRKVVNYRAKADFDPAISREEAFLWLFVISREGMVQSSDAQLRDFLLDLKVPDVVDPDPFALRLNAQSQKSALFLIYRLTSPAAFGACLLGPLRLLAASNEDAPEYLKSHVLAYVSDEDLETMRSAAVARYEKDLKHLPNHYFLLLALGERHLVNERIERPRDRQLSGHEGFRFLLRMGDTQRVLQHAATLRVSLATATQARIWLAHAQFDGLDLIVKSAEYNPHDRDGLISTVGRVVSAKTAQHMLNWFATGNAKVKNICKSWFEAYPGHTVLGLLSVVRATDRDKSTLACGILENLVHRGHGDIIRAVTASDSADGDQILLDRLFGALNQDIEPNILSDDDLPDALKVNTKPLTSPHPGHPMPSELPHILVPHGGELRRLNDGQICGLMLALARSKTAETKPYAEAVRNVATEASRDEFAWALYEYWLKMGKLANHKWMYGAIGHLGSDRSAFLLSGEIKRWKEAGEIYCAIDGLRSLVSMGTNTAMAQIHEFALKAASKGFKKSALQCMDMIAAKRGLTRDELEDRIIPDCGLDETGTKHFDFGPRQFRLRMTSELKPILIDALDAALTDLPKPNKADDADKSAAAIAEWKIVKKQVAQTARIQAVRLEQAMISNRTWTLEEFRQLLVMHPLMSLLVRRLVWDSRSDEGVISFRVTEDSTFANSSDCAIELPHNANIALAHPLRFRNGELPRWKEIFADYELVPPFDQLGRQVIELTADELKEDEIARFSEQEIPCAQLVFTLDKRYWSRGDSSGGGVFDYHYKQFGGAKVTAVVCYEPGAWSAREGEDQQITSLYFIPIDTQPGHHHRINTGRIELSQVDPVVVSEVLADLTVIMSKAK